MKQIIKPANRRQDPKTVKETVLREMPQIAEGLAQKTYEDLCQLQKQGMIPIWRNRRELTPHESVEALGDRAATFFALHNILTKAVIDIAVSQKIEPDIIFPTYKSTSNEDGTVTLSTESYEKPVFKFED